MTYYTVLCFTRASCNLLIGCQLTLISRHFFAHSTMS